MAVEDRLCGARCCVVVWGLAVSERIVLFRHGPVTFGVSVFGTAVAECIGKVWPVKDWLGSQGLYRLGRVRRGADSLGAVWQSRHGRVRHD